MLLLHNKINLIQGNRAVLGTTHRRCRSVHQPLVLAAAAASDDKPKPRRTRKKTATSSKASDDTETTATQPSSTAGSTKPVEIHTGSLQRLQGSSDSLRELLERRARRQQKLGAAIADSLASSSSSGSSAAALTPSSSRSSSVSLSEIPAEAAPLKKSARVRFWLQFRVNYGENLVVLGGTPEMGNWVLNAAVPLKWNEGDNWSGSVDLPAGSIVEYKYVVVNNQGHAVMWQSGNNSVLALKHQDSELDVYDNWYGNPGAQVASDGAPPVTRENRLLAWASDIETQLTVQRQELRRARMELVAAQDEARLAREEARKYKASLAVAEAEKLAALSTLKQADTVNKVLQAQLAETTASFRQAMETASEILSKLDKVESTAAAGIALNTQNGTATSTSTTSLNGSASKVATNGSSTATTATVAGKAPQEAPKKEVKSFFG